MSSGEYFQRLKQEQENYLKICDEKIQQWEKFKNDYNALSSRLETLPHEIKHDVMVPISKYAFIPGKMIHTNEILVLLGENWFVEKSAKQAKEVVDRRLVGIDKHLEDLNKEKNIIQSQFKWTQDIMNEKGNYVNIEEKVEDVKVNLKKKQLTDEEKKELRRQQQEKALKFQDKIDTVIKSGYKDLHKQSKDSIKDEESDFEEDDDTKQIKTLQDLNLMEDKFDKMILENEHVQTNESIDDEYKKQFNDMLNDYEKNIDRKNNEFIQSEIEKKIKLKQHGLKERKDANKKSVKWSDENLNKLNDLENEINDSDDYDEDEYDDENEDYDDENNSKNEFYGDTEYKPRSNVISITHTKNEEIESIERNLKLSRDKDEINSPADIFNKFYRPKSILKSSSVTKLQCSEEQIKADEDYKSNKSAAKVEVKNAEMGKFEPEKAFSGQIIERKTISNEKKETDDTTNKKKVSKFKASKLN